MAPLDSLMYPIVHRIVSSAFGASCTIFLLDLKSVRVTRISTGRGHRWPSTLLALPALCRAGRVRARIASTVLASRAMVACHRATATPATAGLGHAAACRPNCRAMPCSATSWPGARRVIHCTAPTAMLALLRCLLGCALDGRPPAPPYLRVASLCVGVWR